MYHETNINFMRYQRILLLLSILLVFGCSNNDKNFQLSTSVNPNNSGEVTPSEGIFSDGEEIELSAIPNDGYQFIEWSGDVIGSENPKTVLMNSDKLITAEFEKREYPLNISITGEGQVSERVISLAKTEYEYGKSVEVTANPSNGWKFKEWNGDLNSRNAIDTVLIDNEINIQAVFEKELYSLNINVIGNGSVEEEIISQKTDYEYQTKVMISAIADEGWRFDSWEGDIRSFEYSFEVTVDSDKNITAVFEEGGFVSHGYVVGVSPSNDSEFTNRAYPTIKANWEGVGGNKIWTKMNLGAISYPQSPSDRDIKRRGWVFQFNRKQAFHYVGDYRNSDVIPSNTLVSSIDEDSDWEINNDPCNALLGDSWRVPTLEEWDAFYMAFREGSFNASIERDTGYESPLRLHSPFEGRAYWGINGSVGPYWSSAQFGDGSGRYLRIPTSGNLASSGKSSQFLVRCINDK